MLTDLGRLDAVFALAAVRSSWGLAMSPPISKPAERLASALAGRRGSDPGFDVDHPRTPPGDQQAGEQAGGGGDGDGEVGLVPDERIDLGGNVGDLPIGVADGRS